VQIPLGAPAIVTPAAFKFHVNRACKAGLGEQISEIFVHREAFFAVIFRRSPFG
jgi:hypothetical protein